MLRVEWDTRATSARLAGLSASLVRRFLSDLAPIAIELLEREQSRHFAAQASPSGAPWAPLAASTLGRSLSQARAKVGGRAAQPVVRSSASGLTTVRATIPQPGKQKSAVVRRTPGSQILVDTGLLKASVTSQSSGAVRRRRGQVIEYGSNVIYARAHQFGVPSRKLPARPFLGTGKLFETELARAAETVLRRLIA